MGKEDISRRRFLTRSLAGLGAGWALARLPEIMAAGQHVHAMLQSQEPPKLQFLSPEQAAEVEGVAAQVIPSGETPGAREAGVVYFIDRALFTFDSDKQALYLKGLQRLR